MGKEEVKRENACAGKDRRIQYERYVYPEVTAIGVYEGTVENPRTTQVPD